jgi:ribosome maturation factor RimP
LLSGENLTTSLQTEIEHKLSQTDPALDVLLIELANQTLRIYIDHPEGVTLDLCEHVSKELAFVRERYRLEVSSPGAQRPLSKPKHYQACLGRRARVRTRSAHDGRRSFTGQLVGVSESDVTIACVEGVMAIPYADIQRSNLVEE